MKYKVLWFDDEHEIMSQFKLNAELNGIELIPFVSAEEGLVYFEENILSLDGVIVDGVFFQSDEQAKGTAEKLTALSDVWNKISELSYINPIPRYIYSGHPKVENNDFFSETYGDYYRKNDSKERERLFKDIKEQADKHPVRKIKLKHTNIFSTCNKKYLGQEVEKSLLVLIDLVENIHNGDNAGNHYNVIRKVLESIFIRLSKQNIIPSELINNPGWINACGHYLSGSHINFNISTELVHPLIGATIKQLLDFSQDASHSKGDLKLKVNDYLNQANSSFLLISSIYQLLEIVLWVKNIIDEYPDIEKNKSLHSKRDNIYEGIVQKDEHGNYFCGEYLLNAKYVLQNQHFNKKVIIKKVSENTNPSTNHLYKHYCGLYEVKN